LLLAALEEFDPYHLNKCAILGKQLSVKNFGKQIP